MTPRNIHFAADETPDQEQPGDCQVAAVVAPRLRDVTNDPLREYAARPGKVRPLPDSVAALILSRKGRCVVENHAIKASVDGVERVYSSAESIVIAELNGKGIKVAWVVNRRSPDCLHLMTNNGAYLETVPLKGQAEFFDSSEKSQQVMADAMRHRKRDARRLAELHAPDIAAAAAREAHNAAELAGKVREDERIVRTFPAPAATGDRPALSTADNSKSATARGRESFPKAERYCEVEAAVEAARARRTAEAGELAELAREAVPLSEFTDHPQPAAEGGDEAEILSARDFL